jgi:deazaflavin-dependent oxidoreductase (nitroreductase family)
MSGPVSPWNQRVIDEFRANGGQVQTGGFGKNLVLLHHIGAQSGTERVAPVRGIRTDADTWLIAASKGGAPDNPAWYHNLLAHPDVSIETPDDGVVDVRAENLTGDARDAGWARFKEVSPGFGEYEARTRRVIPVLALRRRPPVVE